MPYQPIDRYGVIGDCDTVALVGVDGSIDFMCFPYFDSPSIFARLLDDEKGGSFQLQPKMEGARHKQLYLPDTNILFTRFLSGEGVAEISDFMPIEAPGAPTILVRRAKTVRGEVRFQDTRIGRAEVRVPVGGEGGWRVPERLLSEGLRRAWSFEDLAVTQLLVTTVAPATGRTDQFYAESVRIEGQTLAGPWRVEGVTGVVPFRLVTGELGPEQTLPVKLSGGGDRAPRFYIDAKATFQPDRGGTVQVRLANGRTADQAVQVPGLLGREERQARRHRLRAHRHRAKRRQLGDRR